MLNLARRLSTTARGAIAGLSALALALALIFPLQATPAQALPAGLPSHFGFGLEAGAGDNWMAQSGIPWDYTWQYLVGGVNTNQGWEVWNGSGQFPLFYAQNAGAHNQIPMFPYYELLQSSGNCNSCNENQRDITNLNTPGVMAAYYANFALLMKRLGPGTFDNIKGYGKTAIINVEPDFAGGYAFQAANNGTCFNFCTGQGNDPSLLKASVANSGHADVTQYSNTYRGFTLALAHIRDLYAPNVMLGFELSPWATGIDIGLDTNPSTNMTQLGSQLGTFVGKLGPHEVLFNDPLDRDAGQYKVQFGQNRWWDRLNISLPNFARWEQYLHAAAVADSNRSILLWQVPIGNQYFDTENNTNGHFQDNRPEYIFGHIGELIQNGIVGVMFGPGNGGSTAENDTMADGVTNPTSFCTSDGISKGQICNNHTSSVSDDDGGYIRMSGTAYYAHPVALGGGTTPTNTPTASPTASAGTPTPTATATVQAGGSFSSSASTSPNPLARGTTGTISVSVTSSAASTDLIDLEVFDSAGTRVLQKAWDNQTFSAGKPQTLTTTWAVPSTAATGAYTMKVGVFSPGWGSVRNWNATAGTFSVTTSVTATNTPTNTPKPTNTPVPPTATPTQSTTQPYTLSSTVTPNLVSRGTSATITTSVTTKGATTVLIDVEVYDPAGAKVFAEAFDQQSFGAGQTRTFTSTWAVPASAATGAYTIAVGVFSPGWGTVFAWNGSAGGFSVR